MSCDEWHTVPNKGIQGLKLTKAREQQSLALKLSGSLKLAREFG